MSVCGSIFKDVPVSLPDELLETIGGNEAVRIERIISDGHASPPDSWYDQDHDEWVMLLTGSAVLAWEDGGKSSMHPGDWVEIPRHQKHRVDWTAPKTVWLAVHYK